jgi:NuA3 HAT complex component NTO1
LISLSLSPEPSDEAKILKNEYELDSEDEEFMHAMNDFFRSHEKRKDAKKVLNEDKLEYIIDFFEKEWAYEVQFPSLSICLFKPNSSFEIPVFDAKFLTFFVTNQKNENKIKQALEFDLIESPCSICGDTKSEKNNEIVFCDGCNVAVHQKVLLTFPLFHLFRSFALNRVTLFISSFESATA